MDFKYPITIYSKEISPGKFLYKGLFGKYKNDISTIPGYVKVQFKKDVMVQNESKILILDSWISFYQNKEGKIVPQIFINDFVYEKELKENKNVDGDVNRKVKVFLKDIDNKLDILSRTNKAMYDTNSAFKSGIAEGKKIVYKEVIEVLKWVQKKCLKI